MQSTSSDPDILLIYYVSDKEDAESLKKELKSAFRCQVRLHSWQRDNPLKTVINLPIARIARRTVFILSAAFLQELDQSPGGRHKLYRQVSRRPKMRALIHDKCPEKDRLVKNKHFWVYDLQSDEGRKALIDFIDAKDLPKHSPHTGRPAHKDGTPQTDSTPPLMEPVWALDEAKNQGIIDLWPGTITTQNGSSIPRQGILEHIHAKFRENQSRKFLIALYGMVGTGKTTIALQYAQKYGFPPFSNEGQKVHSLHPYRVVLWLDASNSLEHGLKTSYTQLHTYDKNVPSLSPDTLTSLANNPLKQWLHTTVEKSLKDEERWLLIINRCSRDDFKLIEQVVPLPSRKGNILVTTSYQTPPLEVASIYSLRVEPLTDEDGAKRLAKIVGLDPNHQPEKAMEIVRTLSGLPLAITNAGYSIRGRNSGNNSKYDDFLTDYATRGLRAIDHEKNTIICTFEILIDEFTKSVGNAGLELLKLCALLGPKPLPVTLIKNLIKLIDITNDDSPFDRFKTNLERFSLLGPENPQEADAEPLITILPIMLRQLKDIIQEGDNNNQINERHADQLVKAVCSALPRWKWDRWSSWKYYLPLACQCIDLYLQKEKPYSNHTGEHYQIAQTIEAVRLLYMVGSFLREHPQRSLPFHEDEDELTARSLLTEAFTRRQMLAKEKPEQKHDYPDELTCKFALVELEHEQLLHYAFEPRDYEALIADIEPQYKEILACIQSPQSIDRPIHPDLNATEWPPNIDAIWVQITLARFYDASDRSEKAQDSFKKALEAIRERKKENPKMSIIFLENTLLEGIVLENLAITLMKNNEFVAANDRLDEAFKVMHEVEKNILAAQEKYNRQLNERPQHDRKMILEKELSHVSYIERQYNECLIEANVNRDMLIMVQEKKAAQEIAQSTMEKHFEEAIKMIEETIKNASMLGEVTTIHELSLLSYRNNLAAFYRSRCIQMRGDREEKKKAVNQYKILIESVYQLLKANKVSRFHPIIFTIWDNFTIFSKYEKSDTLMPELMKRQIAELREMLTHEEL